MPVGFRTFAVVCLLTIAPAAFAEPWIAVMEGKQCNACHISASGGGMRNVYGNVYGRSLLPATTLGASNPDAWIWTGQLLKYFKLGTDVRASWRYTDVPHRDAESSTDVDRASVYFAIEPIQDRLLLYVDQEFGQGSNFNREEWLRWKFNDTFYVRAGRMFLPFGLRLEDDTAYIRQIPGINFTTPDKGVEFGVDKGPWSAQLAVSNGTAGGPEIDSGKQYSLNVAYVAPFWRVGGSFNYNDSSFGNRTLYSAYAGYHWDNLAFLGELDYVSDEGFPEGRRNQIVSLLEANWRYRRGHNLKLTYEFLDPDDTIPNDQQNRYSCVWEYFPIQYLQLRAGIRVYDGIPQSDLENRNEYFVQAHVYF